MKKCTVLLLFVALSIGFNSCIKEDISNIDIVYASDKDEEPDRGDKDGQ